MHRIGVDFGGVIVPGATDDEVETSPFFDFGSERYLRVRENPGAIEGLSGIASRGHELHLISKASRRLRQRTARWLAHNHYLGPVFRRHRLHFCDHRSQKREICRSIGITVMIDDRPDVLGTCREQVPHLLLFGAGESPSFVPCRDWSEVAAYVNDLA